MRLVGSVTMGLLALPMVVSAFSSHNTVTTGRLSGSEKIDVAFSNIPFAAITSSSCKNSHKTAPSIATTRLAMARNDASENSPFSLPKITSPLYAALYVVFLAFAVYASNAEGPEASQAILDKFIADPIHPPGLNLLFVCVFNLLGLVALPMACLVIPGSKNQQLPALPFVLGSAFAGYGSLGLYMMTRTPQECVAKSDLGWFTANVLENKAFNWFVVAMACSTFWVTGFLPALLDGTSSLSSQIEGYSELLSQTALASASSLDLLILTLTAASLIPEDLQRRGVTDTSKANLIAASTVLLPVVGSTIYCALRPSLNDE